MGQRSPSTIRLHGSIRGQLIEILVDGGSTHNFLQELVAIHLGLPIVSSSNFQVLIGNGDTLSCSGVCLGVALELDGHTFFVDLFVLSILEADMLLKV
ncbi:hypothetical protein Pint_07710 [Pistacia integerrima]|uniref:Uncharacterized protein n=1 Tax=Pistacia integerrima TaxID=434235 RepID=A0ACC0XXC0_9ROSI|nr:hypothetical protein Pint_07710 [Pistacia integerrima]